MPRPERHSVDMILDASRDLVLRDGARGVTIDRIVATSGAPKGSLYYRFSTVDDLLASMWLRAVRRSQDRFLQQLNASGDPVEAAVAAGLAIQDFANEEPADAQLLAAVRREDLVGEVSDPALAVALQEVNDRLRKALTALARRLYGRANRDTVQRTTCAVVDLPMGAIRRHLVSGVAVPDSVRPQLTAAIRAAPCRTGPSRPPFERSTRMSDDMGAVHRCFAVEDRDLEIHEARVLPRYSESHAGVRRLRDVGDAVQDTPKGLS